MALGARMLTKSCTCVENILQKNPKEKKEQTTLVSMKRATAAAAAEGRGEAVKGNPLYLSGVFVLTIRHLQHPVHVHIVGVKGILLHLRGMRRQRMSRRSPLAIWSRSFAVRLADVSAHADKTGKMPQLPVCICVFRRELLLKKSTL